MQDNDRSQSDAESRERAGICPGVRRRGRPADRYAPGVQLAVRYVGPKTNAGGYEPARLRPLGTRVGIVRSNVPFRL
jgi:hypothetical protein